MEKEFKNEVLDDPRVRVKINQTSKGVVHWAEITVRANTPQEIAKLFTAVKAELNVILDQESYKE